MTLFNSFEQRIQVFESKICKNDYYFNHVLKPEIRSKASTVNAIIDLVLKSSERNKTYEELSQFVDTFGPRLTGSEALENSTNYLIKKFENQKLDNINTEEVLVPKWERGSESALMVEPRQQKLSILGLAGSVRTPEDGITAEIIVFNSLKELNDISDDYNFIRDKIVLFNTNRVNGSYLKFKLEATRLVSEVEGLAVLFKSYARGPVYSAHAGIIRYYSSETRIPAASITAEDSDLLHRISKRGVKVVVNLNLKSNFYGLTQSRNLMSELIGTEYPNQMVILSAHLDSWDVGQGAIDDGAGVFISWRALALLKKLGLKTKRTLKLILFTGAEVGKYGSKAYIEKHKQMLENISLIMNSDFGTFRPFGLTFTGQSTRAQCVVYETLQLLRAINSTELVVGKGIDLTQSDANEFINEGIPASGLLNDNTKYWGYSNTKADTISAIDPYFLDLCTIVWTTTSYVLADLSLNLPKD